MDTILQDNKLDVLRQDFPILTATGGHELVYLDSAATSQRPKQVLDTYEKFNNEYNANTHRGAYRIAELATNRFENARELTAQFIGAETPEQIIFQRGATEAINLAAFGWGRKFIKPGDEIILSELEHHSNLVPWQIVAAQTGSTLKFIPFDETGTLQYKEYLRLLTPKTKLVAITHMSNVMGTPVPVAEYVRAAHQVGARVLVDGSQAVPHFTINVSELDVDFYAFSGHKMLAPMGTGVLYAKAEILEEMDPMLYGGSMIEDVDYTVSTWNQVPWKFEAGTQNIPGIIGLGAAIEYLQTTGMAAVREHDNQLTEYALSQMQQLPDLHIYGPLTDRGPVISFSLGNIHPHDLATFLDNKHVAIRSGHHCAKLIMKRINVPATARASFYLYNNHNDIDKFIIALEQARKYFAKWN